MSDDVFRHLPAPEEQRVPVLYAWIATHADGSEGIIGRLLNGTPAPLVTGSRKAAEHMGVLAARACELGELATGKKVTKQLVRFVRAETVRT